MKFSPKTRYAIRILFELGEAQGPLPAAVLSERTGLSFRVVETVHTVLKRHGVTTARVGSRGGISLSLPFDDISLGNVVRWFDSGVELGVCCGDKAHDCPRQEVCVTRRMWQAVSRKIEFALDTILLRDIVGQDLDEVFAPVEHVTAAMFPRPERGFADLPWQPARPDVRAYL